MKRVNLVFIRLIFVKIGIYVEIVKTEMRMLISNIRNSVSCIIHELNKGAPLCVSPAPGHTRLTKNKTSVYVQHKIYWQKVCYLSSLTGTSIYPPRVDKTFTFPSTLSFPFTCTIKRTVLLSPGTV